MIVSGIEVVTPSTASVDTIWVQPDDGLNFARSLPFVHHLTPINPMPLTPIHGRMMWSDCVIRSNASLELGARIKFVHVDRFYDVIPVTLDAKLGVYTCVVNVVQRIDADV